MGFTIVKRLFASAYEPKNLLRTNVIASGALLMLGDGIQQSIELHTQTHETGKATSGQTNSNTIAGQA